MRALIETLSRDESLPDGTPVRVLPHRAASQAARRLSLGLRRLEIEALRQGVVPERYLRNFNTLDRAAQARLLETRVALAGLGGLGGPILEGLARMGFGRISAADHDIFEASNLNRQTLATESTLGWSKARAARARVARINPAVEIDIRRLRIAPEAFAEFFAGADVAIDALGGVNARPAAERGAALAGVPLVTAAVAGWTATVATVPPGSAGPGTLFDANGPQGRPAEDVLGCLMPAILVATGLVLAECARLALGRPPALGGPKGKMAVIDLEDVSLDRFSLA